MKDWRDCGICSSRPHRLRLPTPQAVVAEIERLRRQRWTGRQIAAETGVSPATVSRVLRRLGLNKLSALEPAEPIRRYERERPGELIHLDIKKLGRIGSVGHRNHPERDQRRPSALSKRHCAIGAFGCLVGGFVADRAGGSEYGGGEQHQLPFGSENSAQEMRILPNQS
jgi:transcriptional regulator with XRE-family HTH domain